MASLEGIRGYQIVGPNGNSIFMPSAGCYLGDVFYESHMGYWTSDMFVGYENEALAYYMSPNGIKVRQPQHLYPIRAVTDFVCPEP